jgi:bifunctional oligoribonuclease and PAP phosphatase NrnA
MQSLNSIASIIKKHKNFIISSHIAPDSDAVSSSVVLALGLKQLGLTVDVYLEDLIPNRIKPLLQNVTILNTLPSKDYSMLVVVDSASFQRTGKDHEKLRSVATLTLNIDHHISNDLFGDLNYVDSKASATAEIIFQLLLELGVSVTQEMANLLYAGILDDTGCFRFSNTSSASLVCASKLIEHGASPDLVANALYFSVPRHVMLLRSMALSEMKLVADNKIAFVVITKKMLEKIGASSSDSEGVIDEARALNGTLGAVLVREIESGSWKVSLRSKTNSLDVNVIAASFGGGGHKAAAGCKICGNIEEVESKLVSKLAEAVRAIKA